MRHTALLCATVGVPYTVSILAVPMKKPKGSVQAFEKNTKPSKFFGTPIKIPYSQFWLKSMTAF